MWIFVDGKLVIDLGGVHGTASSSFTEETLKTMGLTAGTSCDLDVFFVERHTTASTCPVSPLINHLQSLTLPAEAWLKVA